MKKFLAISVVTMGTFAGIGLASAGDVITGAYPGWAHDAFSASTDR